MGADYPVGIWGNSYDAFYWDESAPAHGDYTARISKYLDEYPSSWAVRATRHAVPRRGDQEGQQHGLGQVSGGAARLGVDTPVGKRPSAEGPFRRTAASFTAKR